MDILQARISAAHNLCSDPVVQPLHFSLSHSHRRARLALP
jgi:hypothetical protein